MITFLCCLVYLVGAFIGGSVAAAFADNPLDPEESDAGMIFLFSCFWPLALVVATILLFIFGMTKTGNEIKNRYKKNIEKKERREKLRVELEKEQRDTIEQIERELVLEQIKKESR